MDLKNSYFILPSFFFVLFCIVVSSNADDYTITQIAKGQKLEDGYRLVSPKLRFSLQFIIIGSSIKRYLGIRLNTSMVINPIWVANRDDPIGDSNGILSLEANGILRIQHNGKSIVVLNPNQAAPNSNVTATLLDSGNLVLTESNSNSSGVHERLLWQSFDHPTDALLPGMKLGFMKSKTGQKTRSVLTSWLSDKSPSSGAFTLGVDPNSDQLLIQQRGQNYWTSGDWDGRNFRLLPNLTATDEYLMLKNNIKFSFNSNERYFSFDYSGSSSDVNLDLPVLVWVLNPTGELKSNELIRNGIASDFVLVKCKADNGIKSGGCEKLKLPECRTGEERFEQRRGTMEREGPPPQGVVDNTDGLSDCEANCRSNCSCIAYASFDRDDQTGCQFWFSGSRFVENTGPEGFDVYLLSSSHGKKLKWWLWIIIVGSLVSAMVLLGSLSYFWWKRGKREENEANLLLEFGAISSSEEHGKGPDFQLFTYDSIVSATDNFSTTNKLGEGGFGPVYKGKLNEGQEIAVKKLSKSSGQGLKEFKNEIVLIAKLQHMNLVKLLGCSIKGEEKMLIYEYMPNKSLDFFLFDPAGREQLDWGKRINIIEGIAQGLLYLHKYSRLRVIHRDLKASNILLDAEMNPKISDFGMAKIFGRNDSEANTNRIVGTYGYMSPEYAMEGIFSVKSDVFSFGVLLLEIISGRRNTSFSQSDHQINLISYAWDIWQKNSGMELMDPMLATSCCEESFLRCVHVGLLCVQERSADRPTMLEVVSMLTNETMTLAAPRQPAFSTARSLLVEEENSKAKSENCSRNELTISVMEAR